jgi:hypothetical protein
MTRTKRAAAQRAALVLAESRKRPAAIVELIATVALALSTVVAVTAVSIGIARADAFIGAVINSASLATALLIALLLVVMGGLTAVMAGDPEGQA